VTLRLSGLRSVGRLRQFEAEQWVCGNCRHPLSPNNHHLPLLSLSVSTRSRHSAPRVELPGEVPSQTQRSYLYPLRPPQLVRLAQAQNDMWRVVCGILMNFFADFLGSPYIIHHNFLAIIAQFLLLSGFYLPCTKHRVERPYTELDALLCLIDLLAACWCLLLFYSSLICQPLTFI
jgi:hypothetical protein